MASLSLCPQFETNLMSTRRVIELLLQLKSAKAHGKNYIKVKPHPVHDLLRNYLLVLYITCLLSWPNGNMAVSYFPNLVSLTTGIRRNFCRKISTNMPLLVGLFAFFFSPYGILSILYICEDFYVFYFQGYISVNFEERVQACT